MESEKVKEIKELLLRKAKEYESQTLLDILTLINELESENKRLNKAINNVQKGFDNGEFISKDCQTKTLKQFAERLKEHPIMKIYSLHNACERIPKAIDETLKEYENDTI